VTWRHRPVRSSRLVPQQSTPAFFDLSFSLSFLTPPSFDVDEFPEFESLSSPPFNTYLLPEPSSPQHFLVHDLSRPASAAQSQKPRSFRCWISPPPLHSIPYRISRFSSLLDQATSASLLLQILPPGRCWTDSLLDQPHRLYVHRLLHSNNLPRNAIIAMVRDRS
jgi:hypothetical protein